MFHQIITFHNWQDCLQKYKLDLYTFVKHIKFISKHLFYWRMTSNFHEYMSSNQNLRCVILIQRRKIPWVFKQKILKQIFLPKICEFTAALEISNQKTRKIMSSYNSFLVFFLSNYIFIGYSTGMETGLSANRSSNTAWCILVNNSQMKKLKKWLPKRILIMTEKLTTKSFLKWFWTRLDRKIMRNNISQNENYYFMTLLTIQLLFSTIIWSHIFYYLVCWKWNIRLLSTELCTSKNQTLVLLHHEWRKEN